MAVLTGDGLRVGLSVAAGFTGVFVITAGVVSAGLRAVTQAVPWAAVAIASLQRWLRRLLPAVTRLAGGVLVASGLYLVAYRLPRLIDPGSFGSRTIARLLEAPSVWLTRLVSDNQTPAVAVAVVVITIAAAVACRRRHAAGTSRPNGHEPSSDPLHAGPDADADREEVTWTPQP